MYSYHSFARPFLKGIRVLFGPKALSVNQHRSGNCMNIRDFSLRQRISPSALLVSVFDYINEATW